MQQQQQSGHSKASPCGRLGVYQPRATQEVTFEELKHSCSGSKPKTKDLLGGFKTFAASEMQAEIVKPRKDSNISFSSSSADTPSKASSSKNQPLSNSYNEKKSANSSSAKQLNPDQLLPPCNGDIKVLVQVKNHKNFLKLIKQLIQNIVMEQMLYWEQTNENKEEEIKNEQTTLTLRFIISPLLTSKQASNNDSSKLYKTVDFQ